jgi:hypothetical protein
MRSKDRDDDGCVVLQLSALNGLNINSNESPAPGATDASTSDNFNLRVLTQTANTLSVPEQTHLRFQSPSRTKRQQT